MLEVKNPVSSDTVFLSCLSSLEQPPGNPVLVMDTTTGNMGLSFPEICMALLEDP